MISFFARSFLPVSIILVWLWLRCIFIELFFFFFHFIILKNGREKCPIKTSTHKKTRPILLSEWIFVVVVRLFCVFVCCWISLINLWCCHCLFSLAFVYKCPEHLLLWLPMVCNYRWPSKWVDNKRNWRIGHTNKELRLRLFSKTTIGRGSVSIAAFNPIWNWEVNDWR